jgi:hypothetical protein
MSLETSIDYLTKARADADPVRHRALIRLAIREAENAYQASSREHPAETPHTDRARMNMGGRWTGNKA